MTVVEYILHAKVEVAKGQVAKSHYVKRNAGNGYFEITYKGIPIIQLYNAKGCKTYKVMDIPDFIKSKGLTKQLRQFEEELDLMEYKELGGWK
ncbi:hypothetical protein D3C81_10600 [compost metagenome]